MTVLTDTQVVTASGGLVELGYSQITASVAPSATTAAGATSIIPNLTVVCDGSPVLVEFFAPSARCDATASDALSFTLKYDGSVQQDKWGQIGNNSTTAGHLSPVFLQYRMTPTAGSHTFSVGGYVTNASRVGYVGASSPLAPAFLRVSKIVQATQWPAVTTGTIICTSSTRPASPFAGQEIYETDTSKSLIYNGTAWVAPQVQTSPPMCRAYSSTTLSLANTTVTAVPLALESYDTDSMHSTVTNTSRITFNTAGVYSLMGELTFDINATGARDGYILLNGVTRVSEICVVNSGASTFTQVPLLATYSFAAGDYVEAYAWQNSGGTMNLRGDVGNGVWLAANLIGKL